MASNKYTTGSDIQKEYDALTCEGKNRALYNAIGYMQQYNGRSTFLCIAMAMGYHNYEGEQNTYFKS